MGPSGYFFTLCRVFLGQSKIKSYHKRTTIKIFKCELQVILTGYHSCCSFTVNILRNPYEPQKSLSDAPKRPQSVIVAQELTFDSTLTSPSGPPQTGAPQSGTRPRAAPPRPPQPVTRQVSAPVNFTTPAVNQPINSVNLIPVVNHAVNQKPNEISSSNKLITLDHFSSLSVKSESTSSQKSSGNSVLSEFDPLS